MHRSHKRLLVSFAAVAALASFVAPASQAAPVCVSGSLVCISGGSSVNSIPTGNSVLAAAGIGFASGSARGRIWQDGKLVIKAAEGATITVYDVGSESGWTNQIRLGNEAGPVLKDVDNYGSGNGGVHHPFDLVGSVTQDKGVANIEFWRTNPSCSPPSKCFQVENGKSPHLMSGNGIASIAFAYLSEANRIVNYVTNRILVMLDDGASKHPDRDYDDGVWILQISPTTPVPLPPAVWLLLSGLAGVGIISRRKVQGAGVTVSVTRNP